MKVAEMRYLERLSRKEIAARLSVGRRVQFNVGNVNHWLDRARELGVVAFDIDPSFAVSGQQKERLAERLARAFRLEDALVVELGPELSQDPKATRLHLALANATGQRLCGVVSNKTNVFVAGGRTVVQIVRMISRKRPAKFGIRIDPLSGRNWTGSWQVDGPDDLERPLDADDAAVILASAFSESGTRFSQIGYPLYAETATQAKTIMREHCAFLPDGRWNWDIPGRQTKRAICGIGVLHPYSGHRIMRFLVTHFKDHGVDSPSVLARAIQDGSLALANLHEKPDKSAPHLSRVAVQLVEAFTFAGQNRLGYVADVANRLYPCLPLPGELPESELQQAEAYTELAKRLDVVNDRALVMQWSHLRQAPTWVSAGGALKLHSIWTLAIARRIEQSQTGSSIESVMAQLSTDSETALKLLDAVDAFERASDRVQQWYSEMVGLLFR
jgi:hypothetical protein